MKHTKYLLFLLTLTSCLGAGSSSINSSSVVNSTTSTSQHTPNEFDKNVNGRTILKDFLTTIEFSRENNPTFEDDRLNPINYREDETLIPLYEGDFGPVVSHTFQNSFWDTIPGLNEMDINETIQGEIVLNTLASWMVWDSYFNVQTQTVYNRDLSHDVLGDSYYWFNNVIDEYTMEIKRYEDAFLYGKTMINRTFQTGNQIEFQREIQREFDESFIIDMQDDTFPSGFFGAVDRKITTPRSGNNTYEALGLGPVVFMVLQLREWFKRVEMAQNDPMINPFDIELSLTKTGNHSVSIRLKSWQPRETRVEMTEIEEEITVEITDLNWSTLTHTFQLWQSDDSETI